MQRSAWKGAPLGLVVAAGVGALAGPTPLIVWLSLDRLMKGPVTPEKVGQGLAVVDMAFLAMLGVSVTFGAPLWLVLRALRREGARRYCVCGAVLGSGLSMLVLRPWRHFDVDQAFVIIWFGLAGGLAALGFWLTTRRPVASGPHGDRSGSRP